MVEVCGEAIDDCVECKWSHREWSQTLSVVEDRVCLHPETRHRSLGTSIRVPVPEWCRLPRVTS